MGRVGRREARGHGCSLPSWAARLVLLACVVAGLPSGQPVAAASAAPASRLTAIRTAPWDDRYRVVLDFAAEVEYRAWVLTDPDRIAIDLPASGADEFKLPVPKDWMVAAVRVNRPSDGATQVVIDLRRAPHYKIFTVPPGDGRGFRIVCDVLRERTPPQAPGSEKPEAETAVAKAPEAKAPKAETPVVETPEAARPWVVLIDAGHGGRDPGAMHHQLSEKTIVLDVSRRLAERLNKEPGVVAYLTRDRDLFMNLRQRVRKAEAAGADIFISVHVNGCAAGSARGAEVFYLSLQGADDAAIRELAAMENEAKDDSDDPLMGEIAELPFGVDLIQNDTLRRSSLLAEAILNSLCQGGLAASRGVKQANFVVLRSCRVPSALVELGFLSNAADAKTLGSPAHRQVLAEEIASGVLEFRRRYARHAQETSVRPDASGR